MDSAKPASGSEARESGSADGQTSEEGIYILFFRDIPAWVRIRPGIGRRPDGHPTVPPS